MKEIFQKIWDLALPYQDKRDDKGHAEITLHYAQKLLETEDAEEEIVIPAIILHDIGWSQLKKEECMIIFDHDASKDDVLKVRIRHQDESVMLGKDILQQVNYPKDKIDEILEIVSQHDTRKGFISANEGIVRDADKLWRFSDVGFGADLVRNKFTIQELHDKLINKMKDANFFFSKKAEEIALSELAERNPSNSQE